MPNSPTETASQGRSRSRWDVIGLTLIALVIVFTYASTLTSPFIFDDEHNIKNNIYIRLKHISVDAVLEAAFESPLANRPFSNIGFALNYYLHGENVVGYHAVNIVIHLLATIFFFSLVKVTLTTRPFSLEPKTLSIIALLSAFLWSINPIQTQSVSYIVQRMNSQASMFFVLSMLLYARARLSTPGAKSKTLLVGSLLSGILAIGSKEMAATLPFFILCYEWYFLQDLDRGFAKRKAVFIVAAFLLMAATALYFLGGSPVERILAGYNFRDFTPVQRLLTQPRVVLFYLSLFFFPHPNRLNLDHDFTLSFSYLDPPSTTLSLILILALCVAAVLLAKRHRLLSFGILWFLGNLVIESSVIGLEIIFEHRLYLPSMFLVVALVHVLITRVKPSWFTAAVLLSAGIVCTLWTYQRNLVWADPVLFWEDSIEKSPEKARPYNNLGTALVRKDAYELSVKAFRQAIEKDPKAVKPHYNLASALMKLGDLQGAAEQLRVALTIAPSDHLAHNNLALVYMRLGHEPEAEFHLKAAIRIKPDYESAMNNLGVLKRRQGKWAEAEELFHRAIELFPQYAQAHNNLGYALKMQGKLAPAIEHFEKALELAPGYQIAQKNLEETKALLDASER
jgi:Flp pilus assembly protein TadD